ncbi:terminase large subunit domain-containing protein [Mesorhizobium ventifaucium]|uniref:Phage terminase large subunit n=1 Tax=Mesorhizobium ventifaucium TaxID=666020 RepID=A0ABN8JNJ1_9HYPH|nr:terminase large subunit [Mesorhizobium ventifaucium]CAH2399204.1 Phage terminase large subunit [Mesorhizobium ventifaucium]
MQWSTARPDWEARIVAGLSLLPDNLPIFKPRAEKALRIFKRLKLVDMPGKPTLGEVSPEWIFDLVYVVFGCYEPALREQLIQEILILISKKNGKSTIAAGIMVTALIMNERAMGEYLILAPTKDIADNSFEPAYGMITADNALFKVFKPSDVTREIENRLDKSKLAVKSADADVVGGQKAIITFIDELWLFGKKSSAANILSEATGSQASRSEGFVIYATTQSDEPPTGVFLQKLQYFRGVRDGTIDDPASLALIYEYPPSILKKNSQPWRDQSTWYIPNPSLGTSVRENWLARKVKAAEIEGLNVLSLFVSKHFNIEAGLGLKDANWAGAQFWPAAMNKRLTLQEVIRRSEVIVIGIDGGGLDDLLGLAVMGRCKVTRKNLLWSHAWAHEIVKKRRTEIATRLDQFADLKQLTFVKLPGEDVYQLADIVMEVEASGLLAAENAIGVDSFGVAAITKALTSEERGIAKERIVGISQGWKLNGAIKDMERDLAGGQLVHSGLELMDFAVGNAKIVPRGNAISIDKQVSGSAKIDPLMAGLHAQVLMGLNPVASGASGWDVDDLDALEAKIEAEVARAEANALAEAKADAVSHVY